MKIHALTLMTSLICAAVCWGPVVRAQSLSADQVATLALNDLRVSPSGVKLSQRQHDIAFSAEGLVVQPREGPEWRWRLVHVGTEQGASLPALRLADARPQIDAAGIVAYRRGLVEEQYVLKAESVEQRFVIREDPRLDGDDLVIDGAVDCAATFGAEGAGWNWSDTAGAVTLGAVCVFDANGETIAATLEVARDATRIRIDGAALAAAAWPVVVDPEIGTNDFRISSMGPDGSASFSASYPTTAYNPDLNEYLVVWHGIDDSAPGELEIYGQRIDALTGDEVGADDFRISDMGPAGDASYRALFPSVVYNTAQAEYLVVWIGEDDTGPLVDDELEVFGQRIDAATGAEVGANDFRISDMGPDGDAAYDVWVFLGRGLVYNPTRNEYLVVWAGDDGSGLMIDDEYEIFGQRLDGTGTEVGTNDFRISDMAADGTYPDAYFPAVACNPARDEYLVVWQGWDNTPPLAAGESEMFGQLLDGSGAEILANDFRISDMGPDGDSSYAAGIPAVAYNPAGDEYMVIWSGDDDTGPLVDDEREIFGQRIDALTGAEVGPNDFRISDMGPDGDSNYQATFASLAYDATNDEFLVAWTGDDDSGSLVDGENEIWVQRIDAASGLEIGVDVRISDMGADGDPTTGVFYEAVVYNPTQEELLVVWSGNDGGAMAGGEWEIFGQRLANGFVPWLDLGSDLAGTYGEPTLWGAGTLVGGDPVVISLDNALENTTAWLTMGFNQLNAPFKGGVLVPDISLPGLFMPLPTGPLGEIDIVGSWSTGIPSAFTTYFQYWVVDPAGPVGFAASNGLSGTTP